MPECWRIVKRQVGAGYLPDELEIEVSHAPLEEVGRIVVKKKIYTDAESASCSDEEEITLKRCGRDAYPAGPQGMGPGAYVAMGQGFCIPRGGDIPEGSQQCRPDLAEGARGGDRPDG